MHYPTTLADLHIQTSFCSPPQCNRAIVPEKHQSPLPTTRCRPPHPDLILPHNPTEKESCLQQAPFPAPEKLPFVLQALPMPLAEAPHISPHRFVPVYARVS